MWNIHSRILLQEKSNFKDKRNLIYSRWREQMKHPLKKLFSSMDDTLCYWDLVSWLCCNIFLFFSFFLMISGVSDNPEKPKKYCSFRRKEPKQDQYGEKKRSLGTRCKFWRRLQEFEIPSREYPDVHSGPQTFVLSGFCSSSLTYREPSWGKGLQETNTIGNMVQVALILWNNTMNNELFSFFVAARVLWSRPLVSKYNSGD